MRYKPYRKRKKIWYFFMSIITLAVILVLAGGLITLFFHDPVTQFVQKKVSQSTKTEVHFDKVKFSVFRKFPMASVEFVNVSALSDQSFDKRQFASQGSDTLFRAESIFLQFNIWDVFKKRYDLKAIDIHRAKAQIFIDSRQKDNFHIWKTDTAAQDSFNVSLRKIRFTKSEILYDNRDDRVRVHLFTDETEIRGNFLEENYKAQLEGKAYLIDFSYQNTNYAKDKELQLKCELQAKGKKYYLQKSKIVISEVPLFLGGFYNSETKYLFANLIGNELISQKALSLVPEKYSDFTNSIHESGYFSFDLEYANGKDSRLELKYFETELGQTLLKGTAKISDFRSPKVDLSLAGEIDVRILKPLPVLDSLEKLDGSVSGNLELELKFDKDNKLLRNNGVKANGNIGIFSLDWKIEQDPRSFGANGSFSLEDNFIVIDTLELKAGKSDLSIKGDIENFFGYLMGDQVLGIKAMLTSEFFDLDEVLQTDTTDQEVVDLEKLAAEPLDSIGQPVEDDWKFLEKLRLNLVISAEEFSYTPLKTKKITGRLIYENRRFEAKDVQAFVWNGIYTGDFILSKPDSLMFLKSRNSRLRNIDTKTFFRAFDNFGQEVLQEKHIAGKLSADADFQTQLTPDGYPHYPTITAQGKILIQDGELIYFEPAEALSSFVRLSELKRIRFSELENQIQIQNNEIVIPEMNINSSAMNILVSGVHSFENQYTYSIKIGVLDFLARKLRARKNLIEEDTSGKLGVYVSIKGDQENYKIAYDRQKTRKAIEERYQNNKDTIKQILNKSFNWKQDTVILLKPGLENQQENNDDDEK